MAEMTRDELMTRLLELQDFLGVAPDDEGDFARWAEAVEECLSRIYGPEASQADATVAELRQEIEFLKAEVANARHGRELARLDAENERRLTSPSDSLRAAILAERDTRQWGNQQWKDMFGDFWPKKSAEIRRAADDAIDRLLASHALEKYPKGCTDE